MDACLEVYFERILFKVSHIIIENSNFIMNLKSEITRESYMFCFKFLKFVLVRLHLPWNSILNKSINNTKYVFIQFNVAVRTNNCASQVIEFCLAKYWDDLGSLDIQYSVHFRGVLPSQCKLFHVFMYVTPKSEKIFRSQLLAHDAENEMLIFQRS